MSKAASRNPVTESFGFKLKSHKQAFIEQDAQEDCLQVIGVGLPRCGTTSLKRALEILGFDPCHHMVVSPSIFLLHVWLLQSSLITGMR